jgi:hypothetical protein
MTTLLTYELSALVSEMHRLRDAAIAGGWEAVKAASKVGSVLEAYSQAELPGVLQAVGLTQEDASRCIKVSRKLKESGGNIDSANARQLLMLVDAVPSPEPRNPQQPEAPQAIRWLHKVESWITKLAPSDRVEAKRLLLAMAARL